MNMALFLAILDAIECGMADAWAMRPHFQYDIKAET